MKYRWQVPLAEQRRRRRRYKPHPIPAPTPPSEARVMMMMYFDELTPEQRDHINAYGVDTFVRGGATYIRLPPRRMR